MTCLVEAVRVLEMRRGEPERPSLHVHQRDESLDGAAADVSGKGRGRVVGARDEGCDCKIAHGEALPGLEPDRRFADLRRFPRDRNDVVEAGVLEGDEHCHQLGHARGSTSRIRRPGGENNGMWPSPDDIGGGADLRRARDGAGGGAPGSERGCSESEGASEPEPGHHAGM